MIIKEIPLKTGQRNEMVDITSQVQHCLSLSNVTEGLITISSPHTTAGITVNENADPTVKADMMRFLSKKIPKNGDFDHLEGNSDSHIKTSLTGISVTLPIINGKVTLGTWQGIYFCEFDGPRNRRFHVNILKG